MDVTDVYHFDASTYPASDPLPSACRSLGLQPEGSFAPRTLPKRWRMLGVSGSGDYGGWAVDRQVLWTGEWEMHQPAVWNDRTPPLLQPETVLTLIGLPVGQVVAELQLQVPSLLEKFVYFSLQRPIELPYAPLIFSEPYLSGEGWEGELLAGITFVPIPFFARDDY